MSLQWHTYGYGKRSLRGKRRREKLSNYHSDKCTPEELKAFKKEVMDWLDKNFVGWKGKFKIKAFRCYGGDVRLYDGTFENFRNLRNSFRRDEPTLNAKGEIIGWHGTRGVHTTKIINYISINEYEFEDLKKCWEEKEKNKNYDFFYDLIFKKLR
jgi:hypothetical protein